VKFNPFGKGGGKSRRIRIRSGDVIIFLVAVGVIYAAVFHRPGEIIDFIYSPLAGVILLVMIIEFLWLKSGDRTRVYRLEIERLRDQRRRDEELLRRAQEVIHQAADSPESEEEGRPGDWRQRAMDIDKDIRERV